MKADIDNDLFCLNYSYFLGPVWRNLRRAAHDILMKSTCDRHIPIQRAEAIKLAVDLLDRPEVSNIIGLLAFVPDFH